MIDLKGADLSLLVSLDALIEEANVTKAAERLNISQPALSAQLARLRDLFHDPLLVSAKGGRGMVYQVRRYIAPGVATATRQRNPSSEAASARG